MTQETNTRWSRTDITEATLPYLRDKYSLWHRLFDGKLIYSVRRNGEQPGVNDGGYYSVDSALRVKGLL